MNFERIPILSVFVASAIVSFVLFLGCAEDKTAPSIQDGIDILQDGNAIFSFLYVDDPPEGDLFWATIHDPKLETPCNLYRIDADISDQTPFWTLSMTVGDTAPGTYPIIPFFREEENRDSAAAALRYVGDVSTTKRYPAVRGEVVIETAPQDINEWHTGVLLQMHVRAEFPNVSLHTRECNIDCTDEGCTGTCDCEDPSGYISTCELNFNDDIEEETCCIDLDGPTTVFESEVVADPCPETCSWIIDYPHLRQYCQAL